MQFRFTLAIVCLGLGLPLAGCDLVQSILNRQQSQEVPVSRPTATDSPPTASQPNAPPSTSGRAAMLANLPDGSKINVRAQPSLQSSVVAYGTVGDFVHTQKQSLDAEGKNWYYITFDDSDQKGWVHGNLIRFLNTPTKPSPAPENQTATFNTALNRCRSQAQAEFPGGRIQVSQGWRKPDGSFVVNWSASTGASGTCTVDRNGWVTSFVNNYDGDRPANPSIPAAALRGCKNRTVQELGNVTAADITAKEAASYADGTFGVDWWSRNGESGFCRVTRNGNVLSFTTNDRPSPEQLALNRCKQRAEQEIPGARIQVYRDQRDRSALFKIIWTASTGDDGYCRVDKNGRLTEFVNNRDQNSGELRCIGTIFGDTNFSASSRDRRFYRVDFTNQQTNYRFLANLSPAGTNNQGQPLYKGQNADVPSDQVTLVDLSGGRPSPGSEISLSYNGNWVRGRCR